MRGSVWEEAVNISMKSILPYGTVSQYKCKVTVHQPYLSLCRFFSRCPVAPRILLTMAYIINVITPPTSKLRRPNDARC